MANGPMDLISKDQLYTIASNLTLAYFTANSDKIEITVSEDGIFSVWLDFINKIRDKEQTEKVQRRSGPMGGQ